jgi:hypothetical protein
MLNPSSFENWGSNWVSSCLSFFLSASTSTLLLHTFSLLLHVQLLQLLSNLVD